MGSCDEIEPGLFLGGRSAAEDLELLSKLKFTHILTIDSQPLRVKAEGVNYFYLEAFDEPETDLLSHFDETRLFIDDALEGNNNCLVHCFVGMSRSATIVIAYFMKKYKIPFDEALSMVREKRHLVCPNSGFSSQLHLFEKMQWEIDPENLQFRLLQLLKICRIFLKRRDNEIIRNYISCSRAYSDMENVDFKCKQCRIKLFSTCNVLPHFEGQPVYWDDLRWLKYPNLDSNDKKLCTAGLYVEPLGWMIQAFKAPQGKINCPKCDAKLGTFSWSGTACLCGQELFPAIRIVESKIDQCSPNTANQLLIQSLSITDESEKK